ncbi:MAG: group 1 truncated hemoglobin [Bdellovibrio sp.]|nr:group 1 truncated hemoglobin [Bdellovibrio sp.]
MSSRPQLKQIYLNIGGEGPLRTVIRDFYRRMSNDILIGFFFTGKDLDSIAEKQMEFLMVAMGIRSKFTGKNPSQAHLTLPPILSGHFDRRLVLLRETLAQNGLSETDIQVWIDFEEAFRAVVVS